MSAHRVDYRHGQPRRLNTCSTGPESSGWYHNSRCNPRDPITCTGAETGPTVLSTCVSDHGTCVKYRV